MKFKLIIFLMELKLTCPNLPCQISQNSIQSNRNRNFIIRRIDYIEPKKAITNKALSNESIRLEDYKLIGLLTIL